MSEPLRRRHTDPGCDDPLLHGDPVLAREALDWLGEFNRRWKGLAVTLQNALEDEFLVSEAARRVVWDRLDATTQTFTQWLERRPYRACVTVRVLDRLDPIVQEMLETVREVGRDAAQQTADSGHLGRLRVAQSALGVEFDLLMELLTWDHVQSTTRPPLPGELAALLDHARKNVKGDGLTIMEQLCEGGGACPLADLALAVKWVTPYDDAWKAAQKRLNDNHLRKLRWELQRRDNHARLVRLPRP